MEGYQLHILGCRGSLPVCGERFLEFGGATSCYVLKRGAHAVVVDCGSGLYDAGELLRDAREIDIILTHVHYDHMIGLLAAWSVFPEGAHIRFFADFASWFGQDTIKRMISPPFWPVTPDLGELVQVPSPGEVELRSGVRAWFYPANHGDSASVVRLETPDGVVAFSFDHEHGESYPEHIARDSDVFLCDAQYTREEYPGHVGWGHSYWQQGLELVRGLNVKRIYFTHHAPERTDDELNEMERQAAAVCPAARFARAGEVIELHGIKEADET